MTLDDDTRQLLDGRGILPSWLLALLPAAAEPPSVTEVLKRLDAAGIEVIDHAMLAEPEMEQAHWELSLDLRLADGQLVEGIGVWTEPTESLDEAHLDWQGMTADDIALAKASRWCLGVSEHFGERPLDDFHRQVRMLAAVAPDAVAFLDLIACFPRPARWMSEVASQAVPPSPENLYCIHAVADESSDGEPTGGVWLHTHGLLRCGSIELEILDVPPSAVPEMGTLLNTTAGLFLDHGIPEPGEVFEVGAGLRLAWLPWRRGLSGVSRRALGHLADRDELHARPSGILVAPRGRRWFWPFPGGWTSPCRYTTRLGDNPALYVSTMETERRCLLAQATLDRFGSLFERYGDDEAWGFLIKLGYPVDEGDDGEREHLWFEVHQLDDDGLDATLLNDPHHIADLHRGDRRRHTLDRVTEWTVFSPHGRHGPDSVVYLEEALSAADA
ncbi:MAG: DUF4026 domain-containing protein [Acidobacteriota bacterium]